MRSLVIEDEKVSRVILHKFFSQYGSCDVVDNAERAIDSVNSSIVMSTPYDLICIDIMLPDQDGRDLLKDIRSKDIDCIANSLPVPKILMVTAITAKGAILQSFREGCDGYVTKPISIDNLINTLKQIDIL